MSKVTWRESEINLFQEEFELFIVQSNKLHYLDLESQQGFLSEKFRSSVNILYVALCRVKGMVLLLAVY